MNLSFYNPVLFTIHFGFQVFFCFFYYMVQTSVHTVCIMCRGCYSCYFQRTRHFFCKACLHYSTHKLHEHLFLFSNSFCVSCKSVPACFRSKPAQRWVKFTTKVRHFHRLNHNRSEYLAII